MNTSFRLEATLVVRCKQKLISPWKSTVLTFCQMFGQWQKVILWISWLRSTMRLIIKHVCTYKFLKSGLKRWDLFKNYPLRKSHNSCPILIKLCENDYHVRWIFSPSFMWIWQKMWIFYQWNIDVWVSFFFVLDFT